VSADPRSFNNPERASLTADDVPALGEALLNLTRELWVLSDRVMVLEAVLEARGVAVSDAIEAFEPDQAMAERMKARGSALVEAVLAPFAEAADNG
jgi:hypothetical protein